MRYIVQGEVPDNLAQEFLEHMVAFDRAHADCSFQIMLQTGRTVTVREMVDTLKDTSMSIEEVFLTKTGVRK